MFKSLDKKSIYDNTQISFCFEFFSPMRKMDAAAKMARALGKNIKWFKEVKTSFQPTNEVFKLAPTYSNGYKEMQLSTGLMPYQEAIHMYLKVSNIIEAIGFTTERCRVKTTIKLNENALGLPLGLDKLNKLKYLISLDEKKLFELWPQPENENRLIYQNHLQYVQPRRMYDMVLTESIIERGDSIDLSFPESDFFATDFSELSKSKLVVNYISGKNYTNKKKEAVETLNIVIEHAYQTLIDNYNYSNQEKLKITEMVTDFRSAIDSTRTLLGFNSAFPDITLFVDLNQYQHVLESVYPQLRERIFKLIIGGGVTEATINYDTRRRMLQIKGAELKRSILLEGIEFYECKIEGDVSNCLFENCIIKNSKLVGCSIFSNNSVTFSKLIDCDYLGESNEINSSFLDNPDDKMINADLRECLVNRGKFTLNSEIDSSTKIIKR
ncbi:hypothetical protein UFOVP1247_311 [uncultured Caudovirales phage]|jgi:hypothetical protein|uniref:Uncharacterized protein n=1 Tax=uncultured Caudovirales phage TaxID=2100421 RepID=A0A6J5PV25_9CAUD|nr:hypothetical protein UFOVP970_351 [uncultured Caudovirales phage]CAB4193940.1 hypothetical protein UFOVP1247_311 [uncultured Caudovirales phage]